MRDSRIHHEVQRWWTHRRYFALFSSGGEIHFSTGRDVILKLSSQWQLDYSNVGLLYDTFQKKYQVLLGYRCSLSTCDWCFKWHSRAASTSGTCHSVSRFHKIQNRDPLQITTCKTVCDLQQSCSTMIRFKRDYTVPFVICWRVLERKLYLRPSANKAWSSTLNEQNFARSTKIHSQYRHA